MKNNTKKITLSLKVKIKNFFSFHHATAVVNEKIEKSIYACADTLIPEVDICAGKFKKMVCDFFRRFRNSENYGLIDVLNV